MENDFGDLSVVDIGVLSCGGVDGVWAVLEEYGEYDAYVYWAGGLGCYGGVFGKVFEGAEVVAGVVL